MTTNNTNIFHLGPLGRVPRAEGGAEAGRKEGGGRNGSGRGRWLQAAAPNMCF